MCECRGVTVCLCKWALWVSVRVQTRAGRSLARPPGRSCWRSGALMTAGDCNYVPGIFLIKVW